MYILDAAAIVLIMLYLLAYQPLVDAMTQIGARVAIFGLIILSFVMAFVDIAKTTRIAEERVRSGSIKLPQ